MKLDKAEIFYIIKCIETDYSRNEIVLKKKNKDWIKNIIKKLQHKFKELS